jgi:hypothetical protein
MFHRFHWCQRTNNADVYEDLLRQHVVPRIQQTYPDGNYVFQQDSALAHTTAIFSRPEPAGLFIWSVLQEKVYGRPLGLIMIIISLRFSRKKGSKRGSFFAKKLCDYRDNRYFAKN